MKMSINICTQDIIVGRSRDASSLSKYTAISKHFPLEFHLDKSLNGFRNFRNVQN